MRLYSDEWCWSDLGGVGDEEETGVMRSVKECLKMGCWTVIKSFHVKIILLDKQELIQEIQVRNQGISGAGKLLRR